MAWFKKKTPRAAEVGANPDPVITLDPGPQKEPDPVPQSEPAPQAPPSTGGDKVSIMGMLNDQLLKKANNPDTGNTSALNSQIVQAVQFTNAEAFSYAPAQIAVPPDMMISQAAGLVAQSAAGYFDGVSKLALAAQAVLIKQMTENIVKENVTGAAEDALGVLATDLMVGAAAAVAAAAGAMEADAAAVAIDKIDASIAKYADTLANRSAS
ncbi:hypothetical protein [Pseudomonas piscis]|uniref:hypothetical protein n=1 Tax=Pseudomonas piscis TaxID=2614538 RepID=UPI0024C12D3C|nr:hypothetical protein [Pseudomonas piscis]